MPLRAEGQSAEKQKETSPLGRLQLTDVTAIIPQTPVRVAPLSLDIARGNGLRLRGDWKGEDHLTE